VVEEGWLEFLLNVNAAGLSADFRSGPGLADGSIGGKRGTFTEL